MSQIYIATNLVNGKRYVGKTSGPLRRRWLQHIAAAMSDRHNRSFQNAIRKYGKRNFYVCTVAIENDPVKLNLLERQFIKQFGTADPRRGYNLTEGGDGISGPAVEKLRAYRLGRSLSESTKAKISKTKTGVRMSADARASISRGHKGLVKSAETCEKLRQAHLGRSQSEETKRKISLARKAKTHCIRGHEFTPANTYFRPNGKRGCRECRYQADREVKAKKALERRARGLRKPGPKRKVTT